MRTNNLKYYLLLVLMVGVNSCTILSNKSSGRNTENLEFNSSNRELVEAFNWAKYKALSFAHDNSDPVGYWYEAALPNREAFCMRDVSHQAIGAEILGLSQHNFNMYLKFARNISKEKDYCTYWEINRYNKPAPVDYENDNDFWYNLPSNFDLTFSAYRLYKWTGNEEYLVNSDLNKFYETSLNEYIDHWDLGSDEILNRNRLMHQNGAPVNSRFGSNRGIPTYNEGGIGETLLGIDLTASMIAAYSAYSEILNLRGELHESEKYYNKAQQEQEFLDKFWWDSEMQEYRSIYYEDETFDYFMVGKNQAFLHYLLYFGAISDNNKITSIVDRYEANFNNLIVELKSYLPIIFYENDRSELANELIINLCSVENKRRDYPENSFTIIEHLTRGLMGINVNAASNIFSTLPRLEKDVDWAELKNIPLLSNIITVKHYGKSKTIVTNESGSTVIWSAELPGIHEFLYLNGHKIKCAVGGSSSHLYSYYTVELNEGDVATISDKP